MKQRIISIAAALALCLSLLPGTAWAAEGDPGVTIKCAYNDPVTLEDGGIYVAAAGNNGVEKVDAAPEGGAYLEYSSGTLTVCGAFEVTARITINTDLTITGEAGSSLEVTDVGPAIQLCGSSTVTLDGGVDFTASSRSTAIGGYASNYNELKTFTTSNDYSGNIEIINTTDGAPAVAYVALDLKSSASIAITSQVQYSSFYPAPESIVLKSNGDVTLSNVFWSTVPPLTVEGENIYIEQNSGPSVYNGGLLSITAKKDVTIVKGGTGTSPALIGSAKISAGGNVTISGSGIPVRPYNGTGSLTVKNAESVSITGTTDANDSYRAQLFTVPVTFENCGNVTVTDNGNGALMGEDVTVASDRPWTAATGGDAVTVPGGSWTSGGDISSTLNNGRYEISPAVPTIYEAGEGKILYKPAAEGGTAVLTLDGASFNDSLWILSTRPVQIELNGENQIEGINTGALTLTGTGSFAGTLLVSEFTNNSTGKLDAVVGVLVPGTGVYGYTVYGERSTSDSMFHVSTSVPLTIAEGAVLTVDTADGLTIIDLAGLTNNGTIINNAGIRINADENAADADISAFIKGLKLTGTGNVSVKKGSGTGDADTYTNGGLKLLDPPGTDGRLDLSGADSADTANWATQGYKWENVVKDDVSGAITSGTLTLAPGFNATSVTLPDAAVTIVTEGESRIGELIGYDIAGSGPQKTELTFSGRGPLTVDKRINLAGGSGNTITVAEDAQVTANNGIYVGSTGESSVTVNGILKAAGFAEPLGNSPAVTAGKVEVGDTGVLEVSGAAGVQLNGMYQGSTYDFNQLFTVTGNGRFTAECSEYNIFVSATNTDNYPKDGDGNVDASKVIVLSDEYMPDDCEVRLDGNNIQLFKKGTDEVYSGALTIHKNHTWAAAWTQGGTTHWHACAFAGCTGKQPGSEAAHFYRSCVCTVCGYRAPAGTPDSGSGGSGGSSGGGSDRDSSYTVTVEKAAHGKVTADRRTASRGDTVTLTVTPDTGCVLDTLTVTDSRENEIRLTAQGDGRYTFTMPDRAVTVKAAFAPLPDGKACDGGGDCPSRGFTDLGTVGTWYHEAVDYALRSNLMGGYGSGLFGPNDTLTRAQFTQILFNKEGRPVVNYLLRYNDVAEGAWYTEAIRWAASQGIVSGYGGGMFCPDDSITREQLAVMLWRYAGCPAGAEGGLAFTDADAAGGYALEALSWAVENGIMGGYGDGRLNPKGPATRAQAAQMLRNLLEDR